MANYSIKLLKDEDNIPFVPLTSTECIKDSNNRTLEERLQEKLGPANLHGGENVTVRTENYDCYIDVGLPPGQSLINNLTTNQPGEGSLDAYQGKVLKDSIPGLVNALDSTDATKALSANQGKLLNDNKQDKLTAGDNITIINNVISATATPITIIDNLSSTSGTEALSANQGRILNGKFASYLPLSGGTITGGLTAQ